MIAATFRVGGLHLLAPLPENYPEDMRAPDLTGISWALPAGDWSMAAWRLVGILNEVEKSNASEVAAGSPWSSDDHEKNSTFALREAWRVGSYVMFLCVLEGVLKRQFRYLAGILDRLGGPGRAAQTALEGLALRRRDAEIRPVRHLRDKVFAHTTYEWPRDEDNASRQATSLAFVSASGYGMGRWGAVIGSAQVIVGGEPTGLPPVSLRMLTERAAPHVEAWEGMFRAMVARLAARAGEIRRVWPEVVEVTRWLPGAALRTEVLFDAKSVSR